MQTELGQLTDTRRQWQSSNDDTACQSETEVKHVRRVVRQSVHLQHLVNGLPKSKKVSKSIAVMSIEYR